jgi:hypothetical protein
VIPRQKAASLSRPTREWVRVRRWSLPST